MPNIVNQTMKLSIVLSLQPAGFQAATFKGDLDANLKRIASLGYDGVELAIRDPRLVDLDALEHSVRACSLFVPAIGTGQAWGEEGLSFTDPEAGIRRLAIERIKSHLAGAERFRAVLIIGLIRGIVKPGVEGSQAMDWLVEALQECCSAAKERGVRLALEPINRYETTLINSCAQGCELVERVGANNFGLLLDTFHMNMEEPNIQASIQACGERIFHFHVADSNRWHPGAGHLDFKSILNTLGRTGYRGWVSGEFLPKPDTETAAREGITLLRRVLPEDCPSPQPRLILLPIAGEQHVELLGTLVSASLRSGYMELLPGESVGKHDSEENEELLIPLYGRGEFHSPGKDPLPIQSGCILYNPPHTLHEVINTGDEPLRYIYILSKDCLLPSKNKYIE